MIATRNRVYILNRLLDTIVRQSAPPDSFEIIVVDNASTDETAKCVEEFSRRHRAVRYVHEATVGLSHARNAGWSHARGDYVAFVDDDCKLPEHWMERALHDIDEVQPAALGGPIRPFFDETPPAWFKDEYQLHEPHTEPTFLEPKAYGQINGGNSLIRRDCLDAIGGFDPKLGVAGDSIGFGEDTKAVRSAGNSSGSPVYFDPSLYVFHLVRQEKTRWLYNIRRSFVGGRSRFTLDWESPVHVVRPRPRGEVLRDVASTFARLLVDLPRGVLLRDRRSRPYFSQYVYEHTLPYVTKLGFLYEQLRMADAPDRLQHRGNRGIGGVE